MFKKQEGKPVGWSIVCVERRIVIMGEEILKSRVGPFRIKKRILSQMLWKVREYFKKSLKRLSCVENRPREAEARG